MNMNRWMDGIRPAQLRSHWLLGACPTTLLTLLSPVWAISAVPEAHVLIDGNVGSWGGCDMAVLVLDGSIKVRTRRADGGESTETVSAGALINALALISTSFDQAAAPAEFGEVVRHAEVTSRAALVLTLPSAAFKRTIAQYADAAARRRPTESTEEVADVMGQLQALARARMALQTAEGLLATGALPKQLADAHVRALAEKAVSLVLPEEGAPLFAAEEAAVASDGKVLTSLASGARAAATAATTAATAAAPVLSVAPRVLPSQLPGRQSQAGRRQSQTGGRRQSHVGRSEGGGSEGATTAASASASSEFPPFHDIMDFGHDIMEP